MSQLTVKLSAKADALIAQLQKEIFNRRRKKVSAAGVVETLVESGAKSQSDKRYAASWKNLIKDIEKAAKVSEVHGNKPANISSEEWALVLSHRTRKDSTKKITSSKSALKAKPKAKSNAKTKTTSEKKGAVKKKPSSAKATKAMTPRPARRARKSTSEKVAIPVDS